MGDPRDGGTRTFSDWQRYRSAFSEAIGLPAMSEHLPGVTMTVQLAVSHERAASAERSSPGRISSVHRVIQRAGITATDLTYAARRWPPAHGEHALYIEGGAGAIPAPDHLYDLAADRGHRLLARHLLHAGLVVIVVAIRADRLTRGRAIWLTMALKSGRPVRAILVWPVYVPLLRSRRLIRPCGAVAASSSTH